MRIRSRLMLAVLALVLVAAACSNSDSGDSNASDDTTDVSVTVDNGQVSDAQDDVHNPVDQPGVTDDTITVSSVASTTNPLGGEYGTINDGVEAYFAMINDGGGIYGRQLELPEDHQHDDQLANNQQEVQKIITQDDPFAVVGIATLLFSGADLLQEAGIPSFGWNINAEFADKPALFGERGSFINFTHQGPAAAWVAEQAGAHKVGLLGYNVPQSADCITGYTDLFDRFGEQAGIEVAFSDSSLAFGTTDLSVQVQQMKDAGVDYVLTCMDTNGVTTLAREMQRQNLDAPQSLPNAYDYDFLEQFGDLFEGSYLVTNFAPLEFEPQPQGVQDYLHWMDETGGKVNEISIAGWISAAQFVTGLRAAGPDFTQAKVIDGLNQLTDVDADGMIHGNDWTIAHEADPDTLCDAVSKIENGEFVPQFTEGDKPFICFDRDTTTLPDDPDHES